MAYYRISLTVDTLPARYAGRDVSCSSEMSSKVVSMVQSEDPLPANKHCFSWVARIRANDRRGWKVVPGPLCLQDIKQTIGDTVGISASPGIISPTTSPGFEREGVLSFSEEWDDAPLVASESLQGTGSLSSNAENRLVSAVLGDFGSPAVDVLLASVLDIVEVTGFYFLFHFL